MNRRPSAARIALADVATVGRDRAGHLGVASRPTTGSRAPPGATAPLGAFRKSITNHPPGARSPPSRPGHRRAPRRGEIAEAGEQVDGQVHRCRAERQRPHVGPNQRRGGQPRATAQQGGREVETEASHRRARSAAWRPAPHATSSTRQPGGRRPRSDEEAPPPAPRRRRRGAGRAAGIPLRTIPRTIRPCRRSHADVPCGTVSPRRIVQARYSCSSTTTRASSCGRVSGPRLQRSAAAASNSRLEAVGAAEARATGRAVARHRPTRRRELLAGPARSLPAPARPRSPPAGDAPGAARPPRPAAPRPSAPGPPHAPRLPHPEVPAEAAKVVVGEAVAGSRPAGRRLPTRDDEDRPELPSTSGVHSAQPMHRRHPLDRQHVGADADVDARGVSAMAATSSNEWTMIFSSRLFTVSSSQK